MLCPSVQPRSCKPCLNVARYACQTSSSSAKPIITPMRRMRSACCARAASGHAATLPSSKMNSRRFTQSPRWHGQATLQNVNAERLCGLGLLECPKPGRGTRNRKQIKNANPRNFSLCAGRKRPSDYHAARQRDELAPFELAELHLLPAPSRTRNTITDWRRASQGARCAAALRPASRRLGVQIRNSPYAFLCQLPPSADMPPIEAMGETCQEATYAAQKIPLYSITSSTCASKMGESDSPSACAVLLLTVT